MKSILIIGLGRFGRHLCKNLADLGNQIMIVDQVEENLEGTVLIVTTARAKKEYGVPLVSGMPFITGIGAEELQDRILEILRS